MVRPLLTVGAAGAITLLGALALGSAGRSVVEAQSRNPLTGARLEVRPAPAWHNASWLNTPGDQPLALADLRGRVVLLNFWTFTCWNCTGSLPSLVDFDQRYRDRGLTIVGMHRPEFPPYAGEHNKGNVAKALAKYHIAYPNAQDNDHATWDLYEIMYWPSYVLIDRRGNIRYEGAGEFHLHDGEYELWDSRIQTLLAER
ncbi:MAG TPA: redoxin domain-containing protein [Gemmatimonadales bacterium]|nr:redoxin domain-containing protein [Gemmatimonadales bacterium]